jgi:DNA (cytosine-5)-methyltransferase 3A
LDKGLRVLSICGGIETGLLALRELNIPIAEYHTYEILPEAIAVSSYHFPWIVHHGDVIGADFSKFKGFDLVIAGTCCQSLSRVRIEDKEVNSGLDGKSGIFFEFIRALEEIKPKWFMLENVIPSSDEDLHTMTKAVGVEPVLLDSANFSAQDRQRYYWSNLHIKQPENKSGVVLKDIMQFDVDEKYYYDKEFQIIDMNKKVCATLNVNSMEMNKRIYNPDFKCATLTCINGGYHEKKVLDRGRPRKLTELEYERLQTLPDNYTNVLVNGKKLSYSKRCSLCGNGWNKETIKYIFTELKKEYNAYANEL